MNDKKLPVSNSLGSEDTNNLKSNVIFTREIIIQQISDALCNYTCRCGRRNLESYDEYLLKGENILGIAKRVLDSHVGKRDIDLEDMHEGPYTLEEIKWALKKVSPYYYDYHFDGNSSDTLEFLIKNWKKGFPDHETIIERELIDFYDRFELVKYD